MSLLQIVDVRRCLHHLKHEHDHRGMSGPDLRAYSLSCNTCRGLGVIDLCEAPIFAAAFEAALQRHSHRSLEPRLLRQLLQVAENASACCCLSHCAL